MKISFKAVFIVSNSMIMVINIMASGMMEDMVMEYYSMQMGILKKDNTNQTRKQEFIKPQKKMELSMNNSIIVEIGTKVIKQIIMHMVMVLNIMIMGISMKDSLKMEKKLVMVFITMRMVL